MDVDPGLLQPTKTGPPPARWPENILERDIRVRTGVLVNTKAYSPGQGRIDWQFLGHNSGGVSIDRYSLHHSRQLQMPLLYIH